MSRKSSGVRGKQSGASDSNRHRLLLREDAPQYRRHRFILSGYLPPLSQWGCLHSLFYLHNETGNIITHGLTLLFIVILGPWWGSLQGLCFLMRYTVLAFLALPWVASTLYHTFMPHQGGQKVYHLLLCMDILGIYSSVCIGPLPHVYVAALDLNQYVAVVIVLLYSYTCLYALSHAFVASTVVQRRTCYIPSVLIVLSCWVLRISPWGAGHRTGALYVLPMFFLFILGGVITAMKVPERWMPGRFDLIGNSHQIMHVLVVAAQYCMFRGAQADLKWLMHTGSRYHW